MTSQLISGPDLGGGYLHQLSYDRKPEFEGFVYHAQSGAEDAGGPPKGPLDVLGLVHPPTPCQYGGPRCWHREFILEEAERTRVRAAYNRWRFVLQTLLDQRFDAAAVPIESSLTEILARIEPRLVPEAILWWVGGSTSAWIQGIDLRPIDIDLGTTPDGAFRIAEALGDYLIEPIGPTRDELGRPILAGRAFVGTLQQGCRVEWSSTPKGANPLATPEEWDPQRSERRSVEWNGHRLLVSRVEYSLVRSAEKGRGDRVAQIARYLGNHGVDWDLLDRALKASSMIATDRKAVREKVALECSTLPADGSKG